jgi:hypothetical protein
MRTPAAIAQWPSVHLEGRVPVTSVSSPSKEALTREVFMSSGFLLLHLFLWSFSTSISNAPTELPIGFPSNIIVQPELRAAVVRLWSGSPTFRAQCLKIGERPRYRVALVLDAAISLDRNKCRAQCVMRVYSSGFVIARVSLPDSRDLDELIPHEFEHVVEHIEGVDVRRDLFRHGTGTYDTGRGRIETLRATRAGRQARAELAADTRVVTLLTRR